MGRALVRAYDLFQDRFEAEIRARGFEDFRSADVSVISRLPVDGGVRVTDMAQAAGITKQAMGKLVHGLELRGYVTREPDPVDGRALRVTLSSRGLDLLTAGRGVIEEIEAEWTEILGARELNRIRRALLKLSDSLGPPDTL